MMSSGSDLTFLPLNFTYKRHESYIFNFFDILLNICQFIFHSPKNLRSRASSNSELFLSVLENSLGLVLYRKTWYPGTFPVGRMKTKRATQSVDTASGEGAPHQERRAFVVIHVYIYIYIKHIYGAFHVKSNVSIH